MWTDVPPEQVRAVAEQLTAAFTPQQGQARVDCVKRFTPVSFPRRQEPKTHLPYAS